MSFDSDKTRSDESVSDHGDVVTELEEVKIQPAKTSKRPPLKRERSISFCDDDVATAKKDSTSNGDGPSGQQNGSVTRKLSQTATSAKRKLLRRLSTIPYAGLYLAV